MPRSNFQLILNHSIRVGRRSGFTVTDMGQRLSTGETVIHSGLSCYVDFNPGKYITDKSGNFAKYDFIVFAEKTANVQPGDFIYPNTFVVGLTMGRVLNVGIIPDFSGMTHHIEFMVEKVS